MTPALLEAILDHARAESPREACGVLIWDGAINAIYRPCRNIGEMDQFDIHPEDWAAAEDAGMVLGVVHSHPTGTVAPSEADVIGCDRSGLPWWIFTLEGSWSRVLPKGWALTGHSFVWGVQECYTLASDYFGGLPDFIRAPEFWRHEDLFMEHLSAAGFVVVEGDPIPGDALLFKVRGKSIDHCAVYLGEGRIVHQPTSRLGVEELMGALVGKLACVVRRVPC